MSFGLRWKKPVGVERALFCLHGTGIALALTAALVWPRAGQAALLVPLGSADTRSVLAWAMQENAPLMALDTASGRVVARITDSRSLLRGIAQGIIPIAARAPGCRANNRRQTP